ncbi:MAG: DUF6531 domain-containing protein [candidate division Zixibacteria bacterium]|nr:DUF6531 domain-containing protein [candidate division Zixibacteria bacterium]
MIGFIFSNGLKGLKRYFLRNAFFICFLLFSLLVVNESKGQCGLDGCDPTCPLSNYYDGCPVYAESPSVHVVSFTPTSGDTLGAWVLCVSAGGGGRIYFSNEVRVGVCGDEEQSICSIHSLFTEYCGSCSWHNTILVYGKIGDKINLCSTALQWVDGGLYCRAEAQSGSIEFTLAIPDTTLVEQAEPSEFGPPPLPEQLFGDPVNTGNGNMYMAEKDVTIASSKGLPIEFVRSYNSQANFSGSLFANWKHSYDYSLVEDTVTGDIILKEGTGRELVFKYHSWYDTTSEESVSVFLNHVGYFTNWNSTLQIQVIH